jgi:uncharacterized membrane protein
MKAVNIFLIVVTILFGASMFYVINTGLHNIAVTAFRLGCHSTGATFEVIEKCREMAEEKTKW